MLCSFAQHEAIAADADDARRRSGDASWRCYHARPGRHSRCRRSRSACTLRWGSCVRSAPGGNAQRGTIGAAHRHGAASASARSRRPRSRPGAAARRRRSRRTESPPAGRSAPRRRRDEAGLAEHLHVDHRELGLAPERAPAAAARARARRPSTRLRPSRARQMPGFGELARPADRARRRCRRPHGRCAAPRKHRRIERLMQRQRAARPAAMAPTRRRGRRTTTASASRGSPRRCPIRPSSRTASPPATSSAWLRATGTEPSGDTSQVMTARCAPGPGRFARSRSSAGSGSSVSAVVEIVERDHTVGRLAPEAADIADRKDLGGDLHRESRNDRPRRRARSRSARWRRHG